ncbi:MAG: DUF294 nucleotidyltransferase-like domain-containing protein [Flavobacteriaceae bacterium]
MRNIISERVADFLQRHPPFNALDASDLQSLAQEVTIIYKEKDAIVFVEEEPSHEHFYVVHKGAISLEKSDTDTLVDLCDEGDIFGLRPLMAHENYKLGAKAHEESILYAIPINIFKPYAQSYGEIGNFLIESFASNTRNPYSGNHRGKLYGEAINTKLEGNPIKPLDLQPVRYSKKVITCTPVTTIKEAADIMSLRKIGAIVIVENGLPKGIVTDTDLRTKVATGAHPISAPVSDIMSSPVITYPKYITITQAQMAMMKSAIDHLCITEDGTPNTVAIGILSKHDLMVSVGNNPGALLKAIKRARKFKQLRRIKQRVQYLLKGYLDKEIPLNLITQVITELNDALTKQVLEIALRKMDGPPPVPFDWLTMGSQGRREQLLMTDQDTALVFNDVPEQELPKTTSYFLQLAKSASKGLFTIGYEYCPAEMMASNHKWCLSISEWKNHISHWIINPGPDEVLMSSIFFDFNLGYGSTELTEEIADHMYGTAEKYPIFYMHLASGALQNPSPTGFFRQFLVEESGEYKDFFDVKRRALMPLIDGARVLTFQHKVRNINNTVDRFRKLAELEPNNREIFLACAQATSSLLLFRVKQGVRHNDSGRYIALDQLTKEEKMKLKQAFKTIKELQEMIRIRFKVSNLLG